ncbi:hypothetical protein RND71_039835 [Anisodus tanguticus]|uniref:SPX domain-containing protein n=1 Tax=Anisodus tanguticus TaxID=243964 RepID=A0AAE1UXY5_9SOLA|nr:hypothetical protein RND71_039835 [Anisodus tanguticus]
MVDSMILCSLVREILIVKGTCENGCFWKEVEGQTDPRMARILHQLQLMKKQVKQYVKMVAFGKKLKDRQIQEWQGYYINYKLMKKKVKQYGNQIKAGALDYRTVS